MSCSKIFKRILALVLICAMLLPGMTAYARPRTEDAKRNQKTVEVQNQTVSERTKMAFEDVAKGQWYYDYVRFVFEKGLMTGLDQKHFGPVQSLARAQFAVILHRLEGAPKTEYAKTFPDVAEGQWYTEAILWANKAGIVKGYDDSKLFGTSDKINREQIATMMYRYANYKGYDVSNVADFGSFKDAANVNLFAQDAMKWAVGTGIITGKDQGTRIDPQGDALRAECAAILERFLKCYEKYDSNKCRVRFINPLVDNDAENVKKYKDVYILKGEKVSKPKDPVSDYAKFDGWYTGLDMQEKFDFNTPITDNTTLFAKWIIDEKDTDTDGIFDALEENLKTDPTKADTDGDGLNDYIEMVISTNPLKKDTDGDGVSDYDEDLDGDTFSNGREIELGTNPISDDTDYDGLRDDEEINTYKTNAMNVDTDGDGANDLWEIENGFDPLVANASFEVKVSSEEVSDVNLVSATVDINVNGDQVKSVNVEKANYADNTLVRTTLPGYMGSAYEFKVDGTFTNATISFDYNVNVYGEPSAEFQPRIYYLNEELGMYEELENQTVASGKVSATVTHFSTYILLNKVEFDKVWETEIKPPEYTGEGQKKGLDVVIAIDSSGSMSSNDRTGLRKEAAKMFVDKLGENDRASVVDFDSSFFTSCGLTNDKTLLKTAIDQVDNYGGTNISLPVSEGIKILKKDPLSASKYKFIILLTDGEGSYNHSLSQQALENDIQIYTIGLGTGIDENLLKKIADDTKGRYYFASKAEDLLGIYESTAGETIDYVTDSNEDGISDYYTKLILDGKMPMADHLKGVDLGKSVDYDGDGLKNGEEIQITTQNNRVYVKMISDPTLVHSDADGVDDYKEVKAGSNPLRYSFDKFDIDYLKEGKNYYADDAVKDYYNNAGGKFITDINALIYGVLNKEELHRDVMIQYFSEYCKEDYLNDIEFEETRRTLINTLSGLLGWFDKVKDNFADYVNWFDNVRELMSCVNEATTKEDIYFIYQRIEILIEEIEIVCPNNTVMLTSRVIAQEKLVQINLSKLGKNVYSVCSNGLTVAVALSDMVNTVESISAVSANNKAFEQNIDILDRIISKSQDDDVVRAAMSVKNSLSNAYVEKIKACCADVIENAVPEIIDHIMTKNPYTLAVVAVKNAIALITGIKTDLLQQFEMFGYVEIADAASGLLNENLDLNVKFYEAKSKEIEGHLKRYLTHIAQVRILGEKKFCEWQKTEGILGLFIDNKECEVLVQRAIDCVKVRAKNLNLKLANNL